MATHAIGGDSRVFHCSEIKSAHTGITWQVASFAGRIRYGGGLEMRSRFRFRLHTHRKGLTVMARGAVIGNAQVIHDTRTRTIRRMAKRTGLCGDQVSGWRHARRALEGSGRSVAA